MKKTKLLTMMGAVALIGAIGVGSTFAYLTSTTDTVQNTFTLGNVNFDADSGLKESAVERENGVYADADGANIWTVTQNAYTDLVAGEVLYKDPTVTMAEDSQNAWVFAKITNVTNEEAFSAVAWSNDWTDVTAAYKTANNISGDVDYVVYAKKDVIGAGESSTIFTSVTIAGNVTVDSQIPQIEVKAFAVQAAGFTSYSDAIGEVSFGN